MKKVIYFGSVVFAVLFMGCTNNQSDLSTAISLTWYENPGRYAGMKKVYFKNASHIYENYPNYPKTTIFWNVNGHIGRTLCPEPSAYHVDWSPALQKIILIAMKGVYIIDPACGSVTPVWDKELLKPHWAIDPDGCLVLVTWHDIKNKSERVAILNLREKYISQHYIDKGLTGAVFTKNGDVMFTTYSTETSLTHVSKNRWKITMPSPETHGRIVGVLGASPIFLKNDRLVFFDGKSFEAPGDVKFVTVKDGTFWGLTNNGNIFQTKDMGHHISSLKTFDPNSIIGCGSSNDRLWVATKGGKVFTFNAVGKQTIHNIQIPKSPLK